MQSLEYRNAEFSINITITIIIIIIITIIFIFIFISLAITKLLKKIMHILMAHGIFR